jgi:hypothetical protein
MDRRFALQRMGAALAGGCLPALGFGDEPADEKPTPAEEPNDAPAVEFKMSEEVLAVLDDWERHSQAIHKLEVSFERYTYDSTFHIEKRAVGRIWFEAPDKHRIDFRPMDISQLPLDEKTKRPINQQKKGLNGQFYTVQADGSSRWICRGDILLFLDDDQKTYESIEIPPHMRGTMAIDPPWGLYFLGIKLGLSSLFGGFVEQRPNGHQFPPGFRVLASQWRERYAMAFGSQHNPDGSGDKPGLIHLVASPLVASVARQWSRLEVLIDPRLDKRNGQNEPVWLPNAMKLVDPTGTNESVYVYSVKDAQVDREWWADPIKDPSLLRGYKSLCLHRQAAVNQADSTCPG